MFRHGLFAVIALFTLAFGALATLAQDGAGSTDGEKVMLVLDGSGSMWGQIDGEAKIVIARRVIDDLLDNLSPNIELGLTVYGHREKGNCDDIEMLVTPGAGTRAAIRDAIAKINPKGKTPLSKAVEIAADALRYEENKATVILVSDGIETCDYDPCALGERLEATGIDFTTHVIGFDVADEETRAQLQCLAENTGGQFLTADNAEELSTALEKVSAAPPAEPTPAKIDGLFEAIDGKDGPVIKADLVWTLTNLETGAAVVENFEIGVLRMPLEAGAYKAHVERKDGAMAELEVEIGDDGKNSFVLPLMLDLPEASISAAAEAPLGAAIPVTWTGPDEQLDYIAVSKAGTKDGSYVNYTYTKDGSPLQLVMPAEEGEFEIRYVMNKDRTVLASAKITVGPVATSIEAASEAPLGASIPVTWTGPNEQLDYISVAKVGADHGAYVNYTYTKEGSPLTLVMPAKTGDYEIRYVLSQDNTVLASAPIKIVAVESSISAPATAPLGSLVAVTWAGPNAQLDYISVAEVGADDGTYINYTYTNEGNPLQLVMPPQPGNYEIRYILSQDNTMLASAPITITAVEASISTVSSAPAGSDITVTWVGPNEQLDYIAVAKVGADGGAYETYTYTERGNPLALTLPDTPGDYEIRYILSQGNTVLAQQPIKVE